MPKIIKLLGLENEVFLHKGDWFYTFRSTGSTIWVCGLDDKERTEKILGNEYATIFLNEASQIAYDSVELITTRLNPPKGMSGKVLIDYNPPSKSSWGYKIYHEGVYPDGRPVTGNYTQIKMNPKDNPHNSVEYLEMLATLSPEKRARFEDGDYSIDTGSLWRRDIIKYTNIIPDLERIVIGVDPTGSVTGDECGIVVAGKAGKRYYVLDDYSLNGTPAQWAGEVAAAYRRYKADVVVAEKNYGGDMVQATLESADPLMNVKLITSSRGKILRAEPISALYERGQVVHREPFLRLEDEMCTYVEGGKQSPNRLDAMVFAITELMNEKVWQPWAEV